MEVKIDNHIYTLPESWSALTKKQIRTIFRRSRLDITASKVMLLRLFIPDRYMKAMTVLQIHDIVTELDWMNEQDPSCAIESIYILGRKHYTGANKWETGTGNEYVLADQYYTKFLESKSIKDLNHLCACICRPACSAKQSEILQDTRTPLVSRKQVERTAWKFRFVPLWKRMVIITYFATCKSYIHHLYGPYIFDTPEGGSGSDGINFGWNGVFMSVAESGIFGTFDQVIHTRMHTICMYLVKKIQEQRRSSSPTTVKKPSGY